MDGEEVQNTRGQIQGAPLNMETKERFLGRLL